MLRLGAGTQLVVGVGMFGFAPPATPQPAPTPCPHCHTREALALYATARTEYLRCVQCGSWWSVTRDDNQTPHAAAA